MPLNTEQLELSYDVKLVAVQDDDFYLFRNRTARQPWRWEGTGRYEGTYSERNFTTQEQAIADAQTKLSK